MDQTTYEQEIDLKDLMFSILHKWRGILLTAILLAVMLGGYKLVSTAQTNGNPEYVAEQEENYENELEVYETQKSALEQEVENISQSIEELSTYLDRSVLMQISPYNKAVASAEVYIDADEKDAANLVKAYSSVIKQDRILEEISEELGVEPQYLQELISVNSYTQGYMAVERIAEAPVNGTLGEIGKNTFYMENVNMLQIQVAYTDQETAEQILNSLIEQLKAMADDMSESIGNHSLQALNQGSISVVDMNLANQQQTFTNNKTTLNNTLKTKQEELKKLAEPVKPDVSSGRALKQGIKYGILGGVLGGFIAVFFICMAYLMSGKVSSEKDFRNRFGLKVLGVLPETRKKRILSGIDRWLDQLEGKNTKLKEETSYQLISANIQNYAEDIKKLMVTGSVEDGCLVDAAEKLKAALPGFDVQVSGNMMLQPSTLQGLPQCDGVVLVEKRNQSSYAVIQQELETIKNVGKKAVGVIVL